MDTESGSEPVDASGQALGVGEMPAPLGALNWSAVIWGALWALVYRAWPWFWGLLGWWALRLVVFASLFQSGWPRTQSPIVLALMGLVSSAAVWIPNIWLGFIADSAVWRRYAATANARYSLKGYLRERRTYAILGVVFVVAGYVMALVRLNDPSQWPAATTLAEFAGTVVFLLGGWALSRRRYTEQAFPAGGAER